MLIQSTNKNEKIVLGLLSYTFEEKVTAEELKQLLTDYQEHPQRELLLYRENEEDNFIGLIGVEHDTSQSVETVLIERIALIPSFRQEGIGYHIYEELQHYYPHAVLIGSLRTSDFVAKWSKKYEETQMGVTNE